MFTGIVQEVGKIKNIDNGYKSRMLEISCTEILQDIKTGDSVAVNGCCLTARDLAAESFIADLSEITISDTTFKNSRFNDFVNLETSLKAGDSLGGHFVSGHVDGTAEILEIKNSGNSYTVKIKPPSDLFAYIAPKGSVALDGISLTVAEIDEDSFTVYIIPHTFEFTTLRFKKGGDLLNIEVDLLARYIGNILKFTDLKEIKESFSGLNFQISKDRDKKLKEKLIEYGFYE